MEPWCARARARARASCVCVLPCVLRVSVRVRCAALRGRSRFCACIAARPARCGAVSLVCVYPRMRLIAHQRRLQEAHMQRVVREGLGAHAWATPGCT